MGEPNLLKMKYRAAIQHIIRTVILEKVAGPQVVHRIQTLMEAGVVSRRKLQSIWKRYRLPKKLFPK